MSAKKKKTVLPDESSADVTSADVPDEVRTFQAWLTKLEAPVRLMWLEKLSKAVTLSCDAILSTYPPLAVTPEAAAKSWPSMISGKTTEWVNWVYMDHFNRKIRFYTFQKDDSGSDESDGEDSKDISSGSGKFLNYYGSPRKDPVEFTSDAGRLYRTTDGNPGEIHTPKTKQKAQKRMLREKS